MAKWLVNGYNGDEITNETVYSQDEYLAEENADKAVLTLMGVETVGIIFKNFNDGSSTMTQEVWVRNKYHRLWERKL